MEDLLEEIVGEVYDEYDCGPVGEPIQFRPDGVIEIDGNLILEDLAEHVALDLPDNGSYETAAGLVLSLMGKIPDTGDEVSIQGVGFRVIEMDRLRIVRLLVWPEENCD